MVEYTKVNVKSSDSQLNKLKNVVKNQVWEWISKSWMELYYLMNYD